MPDIEAEGPRRDRPLADLESATSVGARGHAAGTMLATQSRFFEAALSSIPDFVYAFDPHHRFAYANPAMRALFGLPGDKLLGKTFAELGYPVDLADRLDGYIEQVLREGVTVEDEVFFHSPSGYAAYFSFLWGPVRGGDGSVELVVGVSRDTSERRAFEEALRRSEQRLRAATELAGIGIYSWDPLTGELDWDERLRAMWGLPPEAPVSFEIFEAGIHPDDLPRVRQAIAACADPAGDGRYNIEYRVLGRDDGVLRHIATSGQTTFSQGQAVHFIGAATDVTEARRSEDAIRASEAQFRSFADQSSNLIWIGDPREGTIIYRSSACETISGIAPADAPVALADCINDVHPDDRQQVEHALAAVIGGEMAQFEYRIIRRGDGAVRALRDTAFPILNEDGAVTRIGGITEDLTDDVQQVYLVGSRPAEARRLAALVRAMGYRARAFSSAAAFLEIAPVLAPGSVLVDLRHGRDEGLTISRELRARSIALPTVALDAEGADIGAAVAAMKAGAIDYVLTGDEASLRSSLGEAMAECRGTTASTMPDDAAIARVARLTPREHDVLLGLVDGGTNKSIGKKLGISPRTVELHRAQAMNRLNASSLTDLIRVALAAGLAPSAAPRKSKRAAT